MWFKVEEFSDSLANVLELETLLRWDQNKGLIDITTGIDGSLYLEYGSEPLKFIEHNLGGYQTLFALSVAMKYVKLLMILDEN